MKRSEMVSILKEALQKSELAAWASCEAASLIDSLVNRDADRIMEEIEKAGMLPPLRWASFDDSFWDKAICDELDGIKTQVSSWDKE